MNDDRPQYRETDNGDVRQERDDAIAAATAGPAQDMPREVASRIEEIPAADGAAVLQNLSTEQAADVAEYLDPETAGRILSEMDPVLAASVVTDMDPPEASMVLAAMDPDDRVDVLEYVPEKVHDAIVGEMDAEEAQEVRDLEQYPPDTAGGIMTTQVTSLYEGLTVEEAIAELRRLSAELEQMYYVYVVDRRRHLVGVLSMRDLILSRPGRRLSQIMRPDVASVPATMDQEQVARMMQKYGFLAIPVVDARNRLLGIITVDDVVDVLQEEATEDVHKMFGAGAEERLTSPWFFSYRKRVVWLLVNLATAFMAASVVGMFSETIEQMVILAMYMPVIAGMGGNASAQAMAVAVRGIALGQVDRSLLRQVLYRQFLVGLFTGVTVGLVTFFVARMVHHDYPWELALVVALAMVFNMAVACLSGAAIPFVMKSLGFDPAQSATIFATTLTDIGGFFSLLGLATLAMRWLT